MRNTQRLLSGALALAALAPTRADETPAADPKWATSATLNLTATSGNSETLLFGASLLTSKKWDKNEFSAGADATYGKTTIDNIVTDGNGSHLERTSKTSAQNYGAFGQYNRLVWDDRGYFLGRVDARVDRIADIDYRITLSPGVGYYIIRQKNFELSGEGGPGVVFEKFKDQSGDSYITLRLAEKLKWTINDRSRLFQGLEYLPKVDNFGNYVLNAYVKAETDITKSLALTVTVSDTYRSDPAPIPGTSPIELRKRSDVQVLAGVTYKF